MDLSTMGTYEEFLNATLERAGLDIDIATNHIDILGFYEEQVNTPELLADQDALSDLDAQIKNLQDDKATLLSDIESQYPNLTKFARDGIYNDRVEDINNRLRTLGIERENLATDIQNTIDNANRMVDMYVQEETWNNDQDWRAIGVMTDVAKTDWTAQWNMFEKNYFRNLDKQDQQEMQQLSILERADLMELSDQEIEGLNMSDYVKNYINLRKAV